MLTDGSKLLNSLVARPSLSLVYDRLQYAKVNNTERYQNQKAGKAWERGYHSILLNHCFFWPQSCHGVSLSLQSCSEATATKGEEKQKNIGKTENATSKTERSANQIVACNRKWFGRNGAGEPPSPSSCFTHTHTHTPLPSSHTCTPSPSPLHTHTHTHMQEAVMRVM